MNRKILIWCRSILIALSLSVIALPAIAVEDKTSKGDVAVVNGSIITRDAFDREMAAYKRRLASMGRAPVNSQPSAIRKKVLENLINQELLYQESQKKGITVEKAAVNEQWDKIKKRFPNDAELKKSLKKANLSEAALKLQIERGIAVNTFVDNQFIQTVTVSDKEIKGYYDKQPEKFIKPEQIRASHILIKVDPASKESQKKDAMKKIKKIQSKLKKGEDFAALAKEYSEGPSGPKGGDLGYFNRKQMVKPFADAAFALKPGEVSGIVETRFGFHLIKLTGRKPETLIKYEEVKDRLGTFMKQEKVNKEIRTYLAKLKETAKVERLLSK